ncbi:VanW family protein [Pseudonocardia sp. GCM10023141]|uniref:VanW family protein n=1 Tax=Pseudonocardia sp. GCM10023141 TaxID=3252653 RepID=UPI00361D13CD
MPERQTSPGEVTARPGADATDNGNAGPEPSGTGGSEASAADATAPPDASSTRVTAPVSLPSGAELFTPAEAPEPRPAPAPRPRPQPQAASQPDGDESPTVTTAIPVAIPAAQPDRPTVPVRPEPAVPDEPSNAWFAGQEQGGARPDAQGSPDADATQVLPLTAAAAAEQPTTVHPMQQGPDHDRVAADPPTERLSIPAAGGGPPAGDPPTELVGGTAPRPSRLKRGLLIGGGAVVVLGLLYGGDLLLGSGSVPRGVTVVGVPVGGLSLADAEQRLRTEIEPRTTRPVPVTAGAARSEIDPHAAGLTLDWKGTVDRAAEQPLNPLTRITSFFTKRETGTVTTVDRTALESALAQLSPIVDRAPAEGTVRFEGTSPVPVQPVPGQKLDVPAASAALQQEWAAGGTVALPLVTLPPITTSADVSSAVDKVARPAVSAPVTVVGEGDVRGTLTPDVIAAALTFRAVPGGGLTPEINQATIADALKPQLAASEKPGSDATLDFSSGTPVVVPSKDGRGVDYEATAKAMLPALTGPGPRQVTALYGDQHPALTTEKLNALGITGVIGEWTTGGFSADSGQNIKRAAEKLNGLIVAPGATFSLNEATNPRDAAHGYVEAGIIEGGHPARGIGGGVSQVATTLYNASYFAGMVNVHHQEHSFYISRYPAGREATVFDDVIDLKFRNDNPTGVMIQTIWTPTSLTVKIFGTKRYEVTSTPGPRTNPTSPNTITIPAGQQCAPSTGAPGFTITDTRTLKEVSTGQVRNEVRTVRYDPSPNVVCGAP